MFIVLITCCVLTAGYILLMLAYRIGWARQTEFTLPANYKPLTFISVIIPARDEACNVGACIDAILSQKYPEALFEIIVVDDHSIDGTANIVKQYDRANIHCISLADHLDATGQTNAYKKAALAAGIAQARGALIVTTDADCTAPNAWLLHLAAIYEQQRPVMIVAPVIYSAETSIVQVFQQIDFMSMQGITAAAHQLQLGNMSNGANLAFSKAAYEQVGGYEGITHLASGDDYLLMMKMNKAFPGGISYLRSQHAIVATAPQPDWSSFLQQRIRWASKSGKYNDTRLTAILIVVYLFNFSFVVLAVAGFFDHIYLCLAAAMLALKIIIEYIFLIPVARFFHKESVLKYFPFLQPLHILYIVLAGFLGFFGSYKWKGRNVK